MIVNQCTTAGLLSVIRPGHVSIQSLTDLVQSLNLGPIWQASDSLSPRAPGPARRPFLKFAPEPVLQLMPDLQHPPRERIDVFDKVFAYGNFPLYVISSTDRGSGKTRLVFVKSHITQHRFVIILANDALYRLHSAVPQRNI